MKQKYDMPGIPTTFNHDPQVNVLDLIREKGPRHIPNNCPVCSSLQPSGTFKTNSAEKHPRKKYKVVTIKEDGGQMIHGSYDTLEMARASACGSNGVILERI